MSTGPQRKTWISMNPNFYLYSPAPKRGVSAAKPSACWLCHLWLCSLNLVTVTDKRPVWMYANGIFWAYYSLKDRSWTVSFPFMRLLCWPAQWRYGNYRFLGCPILGVRSVMLLCCQLWKRSRHIAGQQGTSWAAIMTPLQASANPSKQTDA